MGNDHNKGNNVKTEHRFLTRREGKKGHHETKLFIDWSGVTEEQLRTLASWAIIHEKQAQYFKDQDNKPPEEDFVSARSIAETKPVLAVKYSPVPRQVRISKDLEAFLKSLTAEEREALLK